MYDSSSKIVIVILAVFLMAGSVGLYAMSMLLSETNPDVRELPHEYDVEGSLDGSICFGEGKTTFIPESEVQHIYSFYYDVAAGDETYSDNFVIAFDRDDKPVENIYDYVGEGKILDVNVTIWSFDHKGTHIQFYVGEKCLIYMFDLISDRVVLTATISDIDL
jgi:hypothetical protein